MNLALQTLDLGKAFGGFVALHDVSLHIATGARHALIGPNGAGKTTLLHLLSGELAPSAGRVLLNGQDVTTLAAPLRVKRGLSRSFQINRLFPDLTVLQCVGLGVAERLDLGWRWWRPLSAHTQVHSQASALLEELGLDDVAHTPTRALPYGRQRLVEIALALATQPRLLLLDEPAAGVPHEESRQLLERIAALPRSVTVVLIEHDMDLVFRFAERITVLAEGRVLAEGTPADIAANPRVREVYLGGGAHGPA